MLLCGFSKLLSMATRLVGELHFQCQMWDLLTWGQWHDGEPELLVQHTIGVLDTFPTHSRNFTHLLYRQRGPCICRQHSRWPQSFPLSIVPVRHIRSGCSGGGNTPGIGSTRTHPSALAARRTSERRMARLRSALQRHRPRLCSRRRCVSYLRFSPGSASPFAFVLLLISVDRPRS